MYVVAILLSQQLDTGTVARMTQHLRDHDDADAAVGSAIAAARKLYPGYKVDNYIVTPVRVVVTTEIADIKAS